ncbi:sensor histidine kinase [Rheinheimera tilapiae]|uniref:Sensor histidine kinase n=1 Tax=Rheinheimera tilapiae TaxID=875043 RepID=A0ABV6BEX3_9GAMM
MPVEQLLPEFCRSGTVLRIIILAQALAILLALVPGVTTEFWSRLGLISLFVHWVTLPLLALLCLFQRYWRQFSPPALAWFFLLLLLLISLVVGTFAHQFLQSAGWPGAGDYHSFLLQVLLMSLLVGVIGIQLGILYVQQRLRLDAQARAELDALQARIRPHFLFNSLNTAAELTHSQPDQAEQALLDLASLFRAALHSDTAVTLEEDLLLARRYLALEQLRLQHRLQLEWRVPAQLPLLTIPCLTLQPLLENAVRHGIETRSEPGLIRLELTVGSGAVSLLIENPRGDVRPHSGGNGIALSNIRRRLELMYGDRARLVAVMSPDSYGLKLTLPLPKDSADARADR